MDVAATLLVLASLVLPLCESQTPAGVHKRFEYKHSFRAPNLAQRDGTIPFWMITGDAIASGEQLRLAPSMRSRKGIAWNKRPFSASDNFELDISFKVTGQGRIGADGLALWYTAQQGSLGPVFGANDFWTGMGLFFDSFDNDGQKNNPFVALMINDGTRSYDHHTDGSQQMLTGCQKDFRNKPFPVRVRIEYLRNVLTVLVHDGMTAQPRYELCLRAENIFLPKNGHFGVSAATGGLADDHDVVDFSTYSLFTEPQQTPQAQAIPEAEKQKYDQEFERQMQEYEKERQKFKQEHPDKVKPDEDDEEELAKYYMDSTERELRQIFEGQTAIHQILQQMDVRLKEIQQRALGGQAPVQAAIPHQQQQQQGGGAPPSWQQHEKTEAMQGIRDLTAGIREMRNYVNEIYTRTYNLEQKLNNQAGAGSVQQVAGGQAAPGGVAQLDAATQQKIDQTLAEIRAVRQNQLNQAPAGAGAIRSDCPTCLSSSFFLTIIAVQSIIIIVVSMFVRSKQDKPKFY